MTKVRWLVAVVQCLILLHTIDAEAFSIAVHRAATSGILAPIIEMISGRPAHFSERAIEQVMNANEDVDTLAPALFFPARHFTNEDYPGASERLVGLRTDIVAVLTAANPDGRRARELLGIALHAIQDFYSHSNWVELGNTHINSNLGRNVLPPPPVLLQACPTDPNVLGPSGGDGQTSGYFVGITLDRNTFGCVTDELPGSGKCFHGNYRLSCLGINKDLDAEGAAEEGVPMSPYHEAARSMAEAATADYVEQVLAAIRGNDKALAALLDVRGTLGFVIGDTGGMTDTIDGVKQIVGDIVAAAKSDPIGRPDNFLLERFGDRDIAPPFVTTSADELLAAVNVLDASGGGDCPGLSQGALVQAIEASLPNSLLYVFTSGPATDAALQNVVISEAQRKGIRIVYVVTGSCTSSGGSSAGGLPSIRRGMPASAAVDDVYSRGATETGGQLFFVNPSEVPRLAPVVLAQVPGDLTIIRSSTGRLSGTTAAFDVPIDGSVSQLTVSVAIDVANVITLRRPSGLVVTGADPDATITALTSGPIFSVAAPTVGVWRVEITGTGKFSMLAQGNSPIEFFRFDFVGESADIHDAYAPLAGQPVTGSDGTGEATLLGPFGTAAFELVDEAGLKLTDISLVRGNPRAARDHFIGSFELPSVPFKVAASGIGTAGGQYRREFPAVYRAQPVAVEVVGLSAGTVPRGTTSHFSFKITNHGTAATFAIVAANSLGLVTQLDRTHVTLPPGASDIVDLGIVVPATTANSTDFTATLTVTRVDAETVFNSALLHLTAQAASAPTATTNVTGHVAPMGAETSLTMNAAAP